ncbi:hypothetical protein [Campylobacter insulaenigrae]|uniref:hypothetical protein n=1 Tax=Campylobacter insulaenigrae TaxID=260714 RepID=UPI000F8480E4|nr:hypothetical protein [Campylobacter insulaenigrae]MCR6590687.1 hypothetical protein [Campylobacter insulaenigrae]MCR6592224.1 hypothetical protein [Campylobacter insulaenigrae]MCR6594193.1 hypothetical protein [Campylobacter insulaenigrae]
MMIKLNYFLKLTYNNLEIFFTKLSNREFILLLILCFVLGFFIVYISFFERIQNNYQNLKQDLENLKTIYYENNQLLQDFNDTEYDLSLKEQLEMFKQDYQSKIQHIERNLNKIQAQKVKFNTFHQNDDFFMFYNIKLEFISDFNSAMKFISNIQDDVKIQNINFKKEGKELKISLNLIFALV